MKVLMAKPGLDGHWRGIIVVSRALRDAGIEVVYGGNMTPGEVAQTALQEDVDAVGLSILSAGHMRLIQETLSALRERGLQRPVVVGGIIPEEDIPLILEMGVARVFPPASPLKDIVQYFRELGGRGG